MKSRCFNYAVLQIDKTIPIAIILTSKLDPPYERNGKVTPVTGINPITTDIFKTDCNIKVIPIPALKYLANRFVCLKEILIIR